jgi:uroporphyrinogen-III synthase
MTLPLKGFNVLVTRSKFQADSLTNLIQKYGGNPIEVPLLTFRLINETKNKHIIQDLSKFQWIFFTSANGVNFFFETLENAHQPFPSHLKIAVVGKKTAEVLSQYDVKPHFIPSKFNAETMVQEFPWNRKETILLIQGNLSREILPVFLQENHIPFSTMVVYETAVNVEEKPHLINVLRNKRIDVLTFTSPSCIHAFFELGEELANHYLDHICLCIGTTTGDMCKKLGFKQVLIPEQFTVQSMVDTLIGFINKEWKENE